MRVVVWTVAGEFHSDPVSKRELLELFKGDETKYSEQIEAMINAVKNFKDLDVLTIQCNGVAVHINPVNIVAVQYLDLEE